MSDCKDYDITQSLVLDILTYDKETGIFTWNKRNPIQFKTHANCNTWNTKYAKKQAGWKNKAGYVCLNLNNKTFYGHRIAWLYCFGFIPDEIDHINGIKSDNKISNLRIVDRKENTRNFPRRKNNTSGVTGVHFLKRESIWIAYIEDSYKRIYLGRFSSKEEAVKSRKKAEIEYGFHENHDR